MYRGSTIRQRLTTYDADDELILLLTLINVRTSIQYIETTKKPENNTLSLMKMKQKSQLQSLYNTVLSSYQHQNSNNNNKDTKCHFGATVFKYTIF